MNHETELKKCLNFMIGLGNLLTAYQLTFFDNDEVKKCLFTIEDHMLKVLIPILENHRNQLSNNDKKALDKLYEIQKSLKVTLKE